MGQINQVTFMDGQEPNRRVQQKEKVPQPDTVIRDPQTLPARPDVDYKIRVIHPDDFLRQILSDKPREYTI